MNRKLPLLFVPVNGPSSSFLAIIGKVPGTGRCGPALPPLLTIPLVKAIVKTAPSIAQLIN